MDLNSFDADELVAHANARMDEYAAAIFQLAGAIVARGNTVQEAIRLAKAEWLSLLRDSELAERAALPPHEQAAARLALRRLEGRQ